MPASLVFRWLIDDDQMFIFEYNVELDGFALRLGGCGFWNGDLDELADFEFHAAIINGLAIEAHLAIGNQLLKPRTADVGKTCT